MNCLICQKPSKYVFTINRYRIFECLNCNHRMTRPKNIHLHVTNTYSDIYFFGGGAGYPNYFDEKNPLMKHGRYYARILSKYVKQHGNVLDVGAAAGFILKGLSSFGWKCYGLEPNNLMAAYARDKLGLEVYTGTIESFQSYTRFDLICFIQVISHLIDPKKALEASCDMLSVDGLILIETWNYKSLTAKILGKHWHEYSPPTVLHWFSIRSLNRLMGQFDFKLIATGRPIKMITLKHAKSLMLFKRPDFSLQKGMRFIFGILPDYLSIPYPSEDLFWLLYERKPVKTKYLAKKNSITNSNKLQ